MSDNRLATLVFVLLLTGACAASGVKAEESGPDPRTDAQIQSSFMALFTGSQSDVTQPRPADVSDVEWRVLTGVAADDADPEARLALLLDNLRFRKALEAFRATETAELGEQLLDALPKRVERGAMPADRAQRLQMQILSVLEADPPLRRQRAQEEARRIGVGFDIRKVNS